MLWQTGGFDATTDRSTVEIIKLPASDVEGSTESAILSVLNKLHGIFSLKEQQTTVLKALTDKKDGYAVLLTGFGKSLIYQLALAFANWSGNVWRGCTCLFTEMSCNTFRHVFCFLS